jgi:hypothetical protein
MFSGLITQFALDLVLYLDREDDQEEKTGFRLGNRNPSFAAGFFTGGNGPTGIRPSIDAVFACAPLIVQPFRDILKYRYI